MSEKNIDRKQNNQKLIISLICIGIVIIALLVIMIFLISNGKNRSNANTKMISTQTDNIEQEREVIVNEDNVEKVVSELFEEKKNKAEIPAYYNVTMNSEWDFEYSTVASKNAYVKNSKSNTNAVYFDVIRADTNETIYESPILTVGTEIKDIVLIRSLEKGRYECVCRYSILDSDYKCVSNVNVAVTINIKN